MSGEGSEKRLTPADILGAAPAWPKQRKAWEHLVADNEIVYEDKRVAIFHDPVDEEHESPRVPGEIRLTLLTKSDEVESLMDLGIIDEALNSAILHGIQQAALRLGLEKTGFEVRAHIYPPLQHRPVLEFKIRSGKPAKASSTSG